MTQQQQPNEAAIYRAVCKELILLMADREVTQEQVAGAVGVRREAFNGYLNGTTQKGMPFRTLVAAVAYLGDDLGVFMERAVARARRTTE
jgi:transcriptional regulator with XRE-family HTH domain